jgi:tyramine---L-glutamate ligase
MRDALLRDLASLPHKINMTVDTRLAAPMLNGECIEIKHHQNIWDIWSNIMQEADALILIAPESNGILLKLTQMASRYKALILGCKEKEIAVFSDKMATYLALKAADIATIDSYALNEIKALTESRYIVKPIDGAGCSETYFFACLKDLSRWLVNSADDTKQGYIVQPFIEGIAASISCLMQKGVVYVLSCNQQLISFEHNQLQFNGCLINGMQAHWPLFEQLANQVAAAFPHLAGYVGIDVILSNNKLLIVEINPRITTSYAGLSEATGLNVTALLMNSFNNPSFKMPTIQRNLVAIHV